MDELANWARIQPDRPACIFPQSGESISYSELDARAGRAAQWLAERGLDGGDMIALLLENRPEAVELSWAARRAGLYYALLNTHLRSGEIGYLLRDSGAKLLLTSRALFALVPDDMRGRLPIAVVDGAPAGCLDYRREVQALRNPLPLADRPVGSPFLYSSGTSGLPKGILRPLPAASARGKPQPWHAGMDRAMQAVETDVYLSPAPFFHAAPHAYSMHALDRGLTVVMLERFEPEPALAAIERYRVTLGQFVPTMFVRMLALPDAIRRRYDLASLRRAIHAAAPCPVHVKERLIAWWGPILFEYYAGTERIGWTVIESAEWLAHKGSVGRPLLGLIHICDEDGRELPAGEVGMIRFSDFGPGFEYHNAPEQTAAAFDARGWATYGDLGWLDPDGYLYLSDRRTDLILCGGVNVYPAEIESVLLQHPAVADAAVIGVPDAEYGERVQAVVQLRDDAAPPGEAELLAFCRKHLAGLKCPRGIDIVQKLPRTETGKLLRRVLKQDYRARTAPATSFPLPEGLGEGSKEAGASADRRDHILHAR